jgi:hypothetical protein
VAKISENGVNNGEVFTRAWVVNSMLDLAGYTTDRNLSQVVLVEPSVGSGAFWFPILERLLKSTAVHGVDPSTLGAVLRGFDLQPGLVAECHLGSVKRLVKAGVPEPRAEEIATSWLKTGDYLLDEEVIEADLVVGNPPYIRSDELDPVAEAYYRHLFPTMAGRADIYVAFYEKGLAQLREGGRLAFICADRWMRNAYGARLREHIVRGHAVEVVWGMHAVDAFEAEVSAYPAITILRRGAQAHAVVAECGEAFSAAEAERLVKFTIGNNDAAHESTFRAHRLDRWFPGNELWPAGDPDVIALLETLNTQFPTLEATGVKVGIGVATGADKAYISDANVNVEPDRRLPIATTNDVRNGTFSWGGQVLLNPWKDDGTLVDLDSYPLLAAEYERHPVLKERFVAKKNPGRWYRTIDKVDHRLTAKPKLLLQDMKAQMTPVYEPGGHYPHHNLYVLTSESWDLKVLGGLLLSKVAEAFISAYGVKMRGGTLRFQAQYLRKIRVPRPESLTEETRARLSAAFVARDRSAATSAALDAYGLPADTFHG